MSFIIGINDEPGNTLGPWTELARAETEEAARSRARDLAREKGIRRNSGVVVMAWEEGKAPSWGCTADEPDLQGGWAPSINLDKAAG